MRFRFAFFLIAAVFAVQIPGAAMRVVQEIARAQSPNYAPPPGALNPQVTQASIAQTICKPGWTRTIRPPTSYTNALKLKQLRERHMPQTPSAVELDHWISLEIGGHPTDQKNLWPQPYANIGPAGSAKMKDTLENALNTVVCGGKWTLSQAQQCLLNQPTWYGCAKRLHVPTP